MPKRRRAVLVVIALLVSVGVVAPLVTSKTATAATMPAGFVEQVVFSGLDRPTNLEFSPDGRVFVAEKSGVIKVYDGVADTAPDVFADLSGEVDDQWDRGLLGIALAPGFPVNPWVYVLYTVPSGVTCSNPNSGNCPATGHLSRLRAAGNHMTGVEQVLVDDWCQQYLSHSIGDLHFGPDGALYASGGDGSSFSAVDYGQSNLCGDPIEEGGSLRSQDIRTPDDPTSLDGAIVRIDPANPGNPQIVGYGLRNPVRFTMRPGTNEIWAGDVGWNDWEEIDRLQTDAASPTNFGWPCYEGVGQQPGYAGAGLPLCGSLYSANTTAAPYYTYKHSNKVVPGESCPSGGSATTGEAFYPTGGTAYPATYRGALFFADYARSCIWAMLRGGDGLPNPASIVTFAAGAVTPVDLAIGPGDELYYVDLSGGTVRRIRYYAGNRPPVAVVNAAPTSGTAPLTVSFDASNTTDPDQADQGQLAYAWDFDNNGSVDATGPTASHTYPAGTYTANLKVTDPLGATDTQTVTIQAGNHTPTAIIDTPMNTTTWAVGDTVSFSGHATDPDQGELPASALTWRLLMQHCSSPTNCHTHFLTTWTGVTSGTFTAPDHEYPSYLQLQLTATDASGGTGVTTVSLQPQTTVLTFNSDPAGLQLAVGSSSQPTPFSRTVIAGSTNSVSAPDPQLAGDSTYMFGSWSDHGGRAHTITAPAAGASYTADYRAGSWSAAVASGGSPRSQLATVSNGDRLDVFARSADGNLMHRVRAAGTWRDWESLGGPTAGNPTAVWTSSTRLDLFVAAPDSSVQHRRWDGTSWSAWESLGGATIGDLVAVSADSGRLDLLVTGTDKAVWWRHFDGSTWSAWTSVGGRTLGHNVSAVADPGGHKVHLFVQGTDQAVWYRQYNGTSWQAWTLLGGRIRNDVTAVLLGDGSVDVFAPGTDNAVWYRRWDKSTWQPWGTLGGGLFGGQVASAVWSGGALVDVMIRGLDGRVWTRRSNGVTWSGWAAVPGSTGPNAALPRVVGTGSHGIDVLYPDFADNVYDASWG
jgi:glucose/arabinose dehydrogenase